MGDSSIEVPGKFYPMADLDNYGLDYSLLHVYATSKIIENHKIYVLFYDIIKI